MRGGIWARAHQSKQVTSKSGMVAPQGSEIPTGVFERIRKLIKSADTVMVGAGGKHGVHSLVGSASITCSDLAIQHAAKLLVHNDNGKWLCSRGPEVSRDPSAWRSRMERTM